MSLSKAKIGCADTCTRAVFITWNVDHGTVAECEELKDYIANHNNTIFYEYAIENKPDGVGKKYHLHILILLKKAVVKEYYRRTIQRNGERIAWRRDETLKINAKSCDGQFAYNRDCIASYCMKNYNKHPDECEQYGESGWKEEYEAIFPSQERQKTFKQYDNAADKKLETFAIDYNTWKENQNVYDEFLDGKRDLNEVLTEYLQCCAEEKRMTLPRNRKGMVELRQMLCVYLCKEEGVREHYKKWWMSREELQNTPSARKAAHAKKMKETDEFIKNYLETE